MWSLVNARPDGTFVILRDGRRYHVIHDDPLFPRVAAVAAELAAAGVVLDPEPAPPPIPDPPAPTKAELMARLNQIAAQIEAMP